MRRLLIVALVANAAAFKFLSNFKAANLIPRPSSMLKRRKAAKVYGTKKLAVITGASSGLGLQTAAELLRTGEYHVFGAVNDMEKMMSAAHDEDFPMDSFTPLEVDLSSFESVHDFCDRLEKTKLNRPIDRLICNAAVYNPEVEWSADDFTQTQQVNYLSHFLMVSRLMPGMAKAADPRVIVVGGATAEGSATEYPRADLGELDGFKAGFKKPIAMPDGFNYHAAKAYKDSKLCLATFSTMLHERYHKQTGIAFSTVCPGVPASGPGVPTSAGSAEDGASFSALQAEAAAFGGLADHPLDLGDGVVGDGGADGSADTPEVLAAGAVTAREAGKRLFQVAHDGRCYKSGVYWSWLEGQAAEEAADAAKEDASTHAGWESIYEVEPPDELVSTDLSQELWTFSTELTGATWQPAYVPKSPCPTLVVIGAITKANNAKQDAKRQLQGLEHDGKGGLKVGTALIGGTGTVVDAVVGNTIGRAGRFAQKKLLGENVKEALEGSYQTTVKGGGEAAPVAAPSAETALAIPLVHEMPRKVEFGDKKLVVVTGTSSGLGRATARALLRTGKYHVVGAVRDLEKMEVIAEIDEFDADDFTAMHVELNAFDSVRAFHKQLVEWKGEKPLDRLICNAAVYQPSLDYAKWSVDGHEQQMQINYLSHFLMISLLLEDIAKAPDPRVILVGSVTGNDNTVGGGGVYPIADLKQLDGLKAGAKNPVSMFDGYDFDGAKAYKDSKLCLMMTSNLLHDRYHKQTGIAFSSIYPGCIAESPLFREKRAWFRKYFPIFMKYITGGFVGETEAGMRLMQVAHDPRCTKSGVYWSWNGGPREGRGAEALEKDGAIQGGGGAGGGWDSIYENDQSDKVLNVQTAQDLWKYSSIVTGAAWPLANEPKTPRHVSQAVDEATAKQHAEDAARRAEKRPGMVAGESALRTLSARVDELVGGGGLKVIDERARLEECLNAKSAEECEL